MNAAFNVLTVPIDASPQAQHGIDVAVSIARAGSRLHFCSVVETLGACVGVPGAIANPLPMIEVLEQNANRICNEAVATEDRNGLLPMARCSSAWPRR